MVTGARTFISKTNPTCTFAHHLQTIDLDCDPPLLLERNSQALNSQRFPQNCPMNHPQLQPQYKLSNSANFSNLYPSQAMKPDMKSAVAAHPGCQTASESYLQLQIGGEEEFGVGYNLGSNEINEPYSALRGSTWQTNSTLMYPSMAMQSAGEKQQVQYEDQLSWYAPISGSLPRGVSVNGSDLETNSSLSPKSLYSDTAQSEILPFSPVAARDLSTHTSCTSLSPNTHVIKQGDSPISAGSTRSTGLALAGQVQVSAQLGRSGFASSYGDFAMPTVVRSDIGRGRDPTIDALNHNLRYNPRVSVPHGVGQVAMNWHPHNHISSSFVPVQAHSDVARESVMNSTLQKPSPLSASSDCQLATWNSIRMNVPSQHGLQDRFHVTSSTDETRRIREADDRILTEGKQAGLTYKEIRKKMHDKPAESTLRGRYRSLTKDRKDRVRKPMWTKRDLELLTQVVLKELDRIDGQQYPTLTYDQQLAKVPWKKVADIIVKKGGSYHFGNSTCKKKWLEVDPRK